ncbi:YbaB/EbfC family nucleoid-associated protein [Glycomyces dulcitolivorans]|uniref:YbaB/EbfC family nucleoid-associated protein n=1 Tax=Glycomyces dulcitolivorans TaxID=2200759 RepID=UPI00130072FE|nr:YbaB/EbfC family nucleoid-associated protein [Glycomyces dulcitolivorans]
MAVSIVWITAAEPEAAPAREESGMPEDPAEDMRRKAKDIERLAVELEGEAVSEDGAVRVVTGAAGNVKELDLRMSVYQMSGVELGELIVETIRAADRRTQADLAQRVSAIMGTALSPDDIGGSGLAPIDPEEPR